MNQSRAVVSRDYFHTRWQRGFNFHKFLLDAIDDAEGIHPVAHHDNSANRFPFALPLGNTFPDVRPERHCPQISDEDRGAVLSCYRNGFQVAQRAQIAEAANHVFRSAHFKQAPTNFVRAGAHFFNDGRERNSVSAKFVGVEIDLVLAHESANGGYLGHSWNSFELVAQIPILKAAQVGQTALMAVIHKRVFIDPSRASRVRPDDRMHTRWQAPGDLLRVLQDTRPRPVQVCSFFKNDEDIESPNMVCARTAFTCGAARRVVTMG